MRIGVVGAGHAGIEAAKAAASGGADVVVFSAENTLPYYRPRIVALAFGQATESDVVMHPQEWYAEHGIDLRIDSAVTSLHETAREIKTAREILSFDDIIIATGARPAIPPFARNATDNVGPLWNIDNAKSIRAKVSQDIDIIIIGGGVIGLETALRAAGAGMHVTILEMQDRLLKQYFGKGASAMIRRRLEDKGIGVMTGQTVAGVTKSTSGGVAVALRDANAVEADFVLFSTGAVRDLTLANSAALTTATGIVVTDALQTSNPNVFACGDAIEISGVTRCSAHEAVIQGRIAGSNACAGVTGHEIDHYKTPETPLTFKYKDFEIHAIGPPPNEKCEEHILDDDGSSHRICVSKDGIVVGVQMVGTGRGFQKMARAVNTGQKYEEIAEQALKPVP